MSKNSLVPINLLPSATAPSTPTLSAGDSYFNTGDNSLYVYNGSSWVKQNTGGVSYYTQARSATNLVLTSASATNIRITEGSPTGDQNIQLPVTSTMTVGQYFEITNDMTTSLSKVNVYLNGGTTTLVIEILPYATSRITCVLASGTTTASWEANQTGLGYLSNASNVPAIYGLDTVSSTFGAYLFENNTTGQISIGTNTAPGGVVQIGNNNGTAGNVVLEGGSVNLNTTTNTSTINIGNSNSTTNFAGTVTGLPATNLGYTTTTTSGTTVTLTNASTRRQVFTGSTAQNVNLPVASTLTVGDAFYIINDSSAVVTVRSSGANTILAQEAGTMVQYFCILASGTTAASWADTYDGFNTVTGTGNLVLATSPTLYPAPASGTTTGTVTTSAQMAGFLGIPQNPKATTGTFSYTLLSSDAGKHIYYTGIPTSAALVIPANSAVAYEIGTTIVAINDLGTGGANNVSISITTDTLQQAGTGATGTRTLARYGVATITKVTATKWIISGNGLT